MNVIVWRTSKMLIVQFQIRHDRWIKALTTHLYRVSLDLKNIFNKYQREGATNLKIKGQLTATKYIFRNIFQMLH